MKIDDPKAVKAFRSAARCCEWCGAEGALQAHHWYHRGMGDAHRLDVPINLVALCIFCHSREEAGQITRHDLLAVIAAREKLRQDDVREAIHRLLRLPFRRPDELRHLHSEALEFYGLLDSHGQPTLAGRMAGLTPRVFH